MSTLKNILNLFSKGVWYAGLGLFWLLLWGFSLGVLINYVLRWGPGDNLFTVRLTNYVMPWLLLGLIPGLIIALVARRQWLAISFAVPTLLITLNYAPLFLPRGSVALAGNEPFKVMSFNIWSRNENITDLSALIAAEQPDILLLQELKPYQAHQLTKALANLYQATELNFAYEPDIEQGVISRYPLTPLGAYPNKGRAQKVLAETPNGAITIWNIHPSSRRGWLLRYQQISALLTEDILPSGGPVILGGDFNTTEQTQAYRLVDQHLDNAHWEAGWGFGFSFPSPERRFRGDLSFPSLVRIDHIFYSDHLFAHQAGTLAGSAGSDHLPIVATLSWVK